jgi:hypothetical protein
MHGLDDLESSEVRTFLDLQNKAIMRDIAEGKMKHTVMSKLIDYLVGERIARLRADELQFIAQNWSNSGNKRPSVTEDLANKLVKRFNNQKAFVEHRLR